MHSVVWGSVIRTAKRSGHGAIGSINLSRQICSTNRLSSALQNPSRQENLDGRRPPPSTPTFSTTNQESDIDELFFSFINNRLSPQVVSRLPNGVKKVDAYLHLRENAPISLTQLDDNALSQICMEAGMERLGGVIGILLDDLEGKEPGGDVEGLQQEFDWEFQLSQRLQKSATLRKGGILAAPPGSRRRIAAVQNMIMGASREREGKKKSEDKSNEHLSGPSELQRLFSMSSLSRAFTMLMEDYRLLQETTDDGSLASVIPKDLDLKTARRLLRSFAMSKDPNVAPFLGELIKHLINTEETAVTFPTASEGCRLMDYYLALDPNEPIDSLSSQASSSSSNIPQTLQAASYILDLMNSSVPDTVSDTVINKARDEGQGYNSYLCNNGVSELFASQISLQHTLRSIALFTLLKKERYQQVERQLQDIVGEMKATADRLDITAPLWICAKSIRFGIRLAASSFVGRRRACDLAMRFLDILKTGNEMEASANAEIVRDLCDQAVEDDQPRRATQLLFAWLEKDGAKEEDQRATVARIIGPSILIRLCSNLAKHHRGDLVAQLISSLGLVAPDGKIIYNGLDGFVPYPLRAQFITALARAGLKNQSKALYERWGIPLEGVVDSTKVHEHIVQVTEQGTPGKLSFNENNKLAGNEAHTLVIQSTSCLTTLVMLFTQYHRKPFVVSPSESTPVTSEGKEETPSLETIPHKDIQFAYHVAMQFFQSHQQRFMPRHDRIALSSVYLRLGQRAAAFKCLRNIAKMEDEPSLTEASALVKLIADINIEQAVQLLVQRVSSWTSWNHNVNAVSREQALSQLYHPVLTKCLRRKNFELVERLLESARANGLENEVGIRAVGGFLASALQRRGEAGQRQLLLSDKVSSQDKEEKGAGRNDGSETLVAAKWVKRLIVQDGWRPDYSLLSWMTTLACQEKGFDNEASTGQRQLYSANDNQRKAALILLSMSAKFLGYIDTNAALDVLKCIINKAFQLREKEPKSTHKVLKLSREVDQVTSLIRWVQNLGWGREDQGGLSPTSLTSEPAESPNKLPANVYRQLIVTYLRVGDTMGAASVMSWARDESGMSLEDLEVGWKHPRRGFKNFIKDIALSTGQRHFRIDPNEFRQWFAGTVPIPEIKNWKRRPTDV